MSPQINIVIPLFNEEDVFELLINRLNSVMNNTSLTCQVILIDDGSVDSTASKLKDLALNDSRYISILLSRNFGHQLALSAGLSNANASEAVFILDGDLQDPPELLNEFYSYIQKGYDVVFAVRNRKGGSFLKKVCYKFFYRILRKISYIDFPLDSGDFSMVSSRVIQQINKMPEESRFLRGMRSWVGYKQIGIEYERSDREIGESKYTFSRLLKLALNGIFNFSEFPIKFVSVLGLLTISSSLFYFILTVFKKLFFGMVPEGFTALLFTIILFGGVQLFCIGIIGEYILRIFFQVKGRPLFIIKEVIKK